VCVCVCVCVCGLVVRRKFGDSDPPLSRTAPHLGSGPSPGRGPGAAAGNGCAGRATPPALEAATGGGPSAAPVGGGGPGPPGATPAGACPFASGRADSESVALPLAAAPLPAAPAVASDLDGRRAAPRGPVGPCTAAPAPGRTGVVGKGDAPSPRFIPHCLFSLSRKKHSLSVSPSAQGTPWCHPIGPSMQHSTRCCAACAVQPLCTCTYMVHPSLDENSGATVHSNGMRQRVPRGWSLVVLVQVVGLLPTPPHPGPGTLHTVQPTPRHHPQPRTCFIQSLTSCTSGWQQNGRGRVVCPLVHSPNSQHTWPFQVSKRGAGTGTLAQHPVQAVGTSASIPHGSPASRPLQASEKCLEGRLGREKEAGGGGGELRG